MQYAGAVPVRVIHVTLHHDTNQELEKQSRSEKLLRNSGEIIEKLSRSEKL